MVFNHVMRWLCRCTKQKQLIAQIFIKMESNHQSTFFSIVLCTNMAAVPSYEDHLLTQRSWAANSCSNCKDVSYFRAKCRILFMYHSKALHNYFIPRHWKYSGQCNQWDVRLECDGKQRVIEFGLNTNWKLSLVLDAYWRFPFSFQFLCSLFSLYINGFPT